MTLFVGDKLILVNPYGELQNGGETYIVADLRAGMVILKDPETRRAVCGVPLEHVNKHFIKPEERTKWTRWYVLSDQFGNVIGHFRTNFKKVQVRMFDGLRSEACCHHLDEFDLGFGLRLAYLRADAKRVIKAMNELDKQMTTYKSQLSSINQERDHMISSLYENKGTITNILN